MGVLQASQKSCSPEMHEQGTSCGPALGVIIIYAMAAKQLANLFLGGSASNRLIRDNILTFDLKSGRTTR